jgi:hypothetical protein
MILMLNSSNEVWFWRIAFGSSGVSSSVCHIHLVLDSSEQIFWKIAFRYVVQM